MRLTRDFYKQDTLIVARSLLGKRLVRRLGSERLVGRIVETEAYISQKDLACHASAGHTPRNDALFGPPGHAYVYFTYGMHWLFNVVTQPEGFPAAVLIRALEPLKGLATMRANRYGQRSQASTTKPKDVYDLCNGPAKLAQAFAITGALNHADLSARGAELWIEDAPPIADGEIATGPRVGLGSTPEPWLSMPWRFYVQPSPFVSRFRR